MSRKFQWRSIGFRLVHQLAVGCLVGLLHGQAAMAQSCASYSYTLTNGTTADASQVMSNFDTVRNCVNTLQSGGTLGPTTFTGTVTPSGMILQGGATDPGWAGRIPVIFSYSTNAIQADSNSEFAISHNLYANGGDRAVVTGGSSMVNLDMQGASNHGRVRLLTTTSTSAGSVMGFNAVLTAESGIVVGAPTGGDKGAGTANFAGDIYKNDTAYSNPDYVLERWATGRIVRFADKPGAQHYTGLTSLKDIEAFARKNLHLPRFGPDAQHGLFSGSDALLASVEEAYLHLFAHESRLAALEREAAGRSSKSAAASAVNVPAASPGMSRSGATSDAGASLHSVALSPNQGGHSPGAKDGGLIPALAEAMRQQQAQIAELKSLNERQSRAIEQLLAELGRLRGNATAAMEVK